MAPSLNYVTDKKGKKTAVQISLKDWNELMLKHAKLEAYKKQKVELVKTFNDIRLFEKGKKQLKSAQQLLNEL